jgi:hypothetical protein
VTTRPGRGYGWAHLAAHASPRWRRGCSSLPSRTSSLPSRSLGAADASHARLAYVHVPLCRSRRSNPAGARTRADPANARGIAHELPARGDGGARSSTRGRAARYAPRRVDAQGLDAALLDRRQSVRGSLGRHRGDRRRGATPRRVGADGSRHLVARSRLPVGRWPHVQLAPVQRRPPRLAVAAGHQLAPVVAARDRPPRRCHRPRRGHHLPRLRR